MLCFARFLAKNFSEGRVCSVPSILESIYTVCYASVILTLFSSQGHERIKIEHGCCFVFDPPCS